MMLRLPLLLADGTRPLPGFTRVCLETGHFVLGSLFILAVAYCVWVWTRKADHRSSWVGFLAAATAALVIVTLPAMVAIYLPVIGALNHISGK
jgi:uncharacterized membrane protein YcjF (UPF0283 family)